MFGERLKLLRKNNKLTQKELSEKLKVSQGHISALEKNEKSPGSDILISLKRYFAVDLNWLLTGENEKEFCRKEVEDATKDREVKILNEVKEWLTEEIQINPGRETWFELQMIDNFESFKKWKRKRDEAIDSREDFPSSKVA